MTKDQRLPFGTMCGRLAHFVLLTAAGLLYTNTACFAAGDKKNSDPGVGKCLSNKGILLVQHNNSWQSIKPGEPLPAKQTLVALFDSTGVSDNGAVSFRMIGDIGERGSFSIFSTAVSVRASTKYDLDLTLDRGIVVFTNTKEKGAAKLRLRSRNKFLDLTLQEPGAQIGVEVFSRHSPGDASVEKDKPVTFVYFLTLKGQVILSDQEKSVRLHEPPGPAVLKWDSLFQQPEVEYLQKLPPELEPSAEDKKLFAKMNACAAELLGNLEKNMVELANSNNEICRRVAVTAMGATNHVALLFKSLSESKRADVRDLTVVVFREWLGRQSGQIQKLRAKLVKERKLPVPAAKTVIHFLIGFDEKERSQPVLYDMLIEMLKHQRLAARELAHWHLVRLVPKGKEIPYDAAGPAEQHDQAIERWRKLIPQGQVPADGPERKRREP